MKITLNNLYLKDFVRESNRIEGITRLISDDETLALIKFINETSINVKHLQAYVKFIQPNAQLRDKVGLDVMVGNHFPPAGSPWIRETLGLLLDTAMHQRLTPYEVHCEYEKLHPFTDGNGRSGRALWAWQMIRHCNYNFSLGFLHMFYYQTLDAYRTLNAIEPLDV